MAGFCVIFIFFIPSHNFVIGVANSSEAFSFCAFLGELKTKAFVTTLLLGSVILVLLGFLTLRNALGFGELPFFFLTEVIYFAATCFTRALGVEQGFSEGGLIGPFSSRTSLLEMEEAMANLGSLDFEGFGGAESGHFLVSLQETERESVHKKI